MTALETNIMSRAQEFRRKLEAGVVVADGAMGTMLYAKGVFINRCFDELNLSAPQMVTEVHQEYVKAGAEILETNTFGANRVRLAAFGVAEKLKAINQAGVDWRAKRPESEPSWRARSDRWASASSRSGPFRLPKRATFSANRSRRWWKPASI